MARNLKFVYLAVLSALARGMINVVPTNITPTMHSTSTQWSTSQPASNCNDANMYTECTGDSSMMTGERVEYDLNTASQLQTIYMAQRYYEVD